MHESSNNLKHYSRINVQFNFDLTWLLLWLLLSGGKFGGLKFILLFEYKITSNTKELF